MSRALPRSATVVALLADIPSTGHVGDARARRFTLHGSGVGERSSAFVEFARAHAEAGQKVLALYPSWQGEDAARAVNFARGATRDDHVAGIAADLSPLALSLVADQLAYLAPYVPPGMVAALSDELPKHLLAGAWLRNVSQLAGFPVSLRQQVGSLAPSVSYLAYCAPSRHLSRMRPAEVARTMPFQPVRPVQLLCSTPDPSITGLFDDTLPPAIAPVATRRLPAQPLGPTYWGTSKYVEFVALSAHPQALAYAAGSLRPALCTWCGEPVHAKPCPFCGSDATRPAPPQPSGRAPGQSGPASPDDRSGPVQNRPFPPVQGASWQNTPLPPGRRTPGQGGPGDGRALVAQPSQRHTPAPGSGPAVPGGDRSGPFPPAPPAQGASGQNAPHPYGGQVPGRQQAPGQDGPPTAPGGQHGLFPAARQGSGQNTPLPPAGAAPGRSGPAAPGGGSPPAGPPQRPGRPGPAHRAPHTEEADPDLEPEPLPGLRPHTFPARPTAPEAHDPRPR